MRSRTSLIVILFVTVIVALPTVVHAAIPNFWPIVPESINRCAAGWGAVIQVVNNIIEFLITIAIVFVAPLMIAYAGFLYVVNPVNASGISKAKDILLNTVVGLVVALAGWLIVDAIMAVLYNSTTPTADGTVLKTWSNIVYGDSSKLCLIQESALKNLKQGQISGASATDVTSVVPPTTEPVSESLIRQQLASAGVQVNHPTACNPYNINGVVNGCTNVGNLLPATVSQVTTLKSACSGCDVTVTAGSEAGHASGTYSHGAGYKVDLRLSPALDAYLKSMTRSGTRSGGEPGPIYTDKCGSNQYVLTSDHWDITVLGTCSPLK